jgi:DNA-binding MarR family transcriptional regulator
MPTTATHRTARFTPKGAQTSPSRTEQLAERLLLSPERLRFWLSLVHELEGTDCTSKTAHLLARRYTKHNGKVYGAQLKMAEMLRVHPNTIVNHVRRLETAGLLTVTRSRPVRDPGTGEWVRRETNRYWLRFPCKEKAANRRVARRRARFGVQTLPAEASLSPNAEALLASPIAAEIMAEIDGHEPESLTHTYTQPNGSEAFIGTKETSPASSRGPGVVENPVVPEYVNQNEEMSATKAIALMRAKLTRVRPQRR